MDFSLSLSLPVLFLSKFPFTSGLPQLTMNKGADGGRKGGVDGEVRGRNGRKGKGSLLRLEFPW